MVQETLEKWWLVVGVVDFLMPKRGWTFLGLKGQNSISSQELTCNLHSLKLTCNPYLFFFFLHFWVHDFPFPVWWDMLVPWRVYLVPHCAKRKLIFSSRCIAGANVVAFFEWRSLVAGNVQHPFHASRWTCSAKWLRGWQLIRVIWFTKVITRPITVIGFWGECASCEVFFVKTWSSRIVSGTSTNLPYL